MGTGRTTINCVAVFMAIVLPSSRAVCGDDWSEDWKATLTAAEADPSRPILVKFEASWCGPCRLLSEAMKDAEAIHLLQSLHTVRIDVDDPPFGAPVEGVEALPTMRVMTSNGEVLSEKVGLIQGEPLIQWLRDGLQQHKAKLAAIRLVKSLGNGQLDAEQTEVLIEMLSDRSPRQRAAAAGLLIANPEQVAASVITAFEKPKLRTRLAALAILDRWSAPVQGIDPWQPETVTQERIADLRQWSETFGRQDALHAKLQAQAQEEAELELDRLVRRGDVREGMIDSLGLVGSELRGSVDQRLSIETADTARERLSAVLYRLVAAPTLAIRLPNVTDQLASLDADPRRSAAKTLSEQAKSEDSALLETLFGHRDPLVRELALRGLQRAGSGNTVRLTKLLEDPDKNVRAAVLKLWLDNPQASLLTPVSEHALREKDSGLLVYYVRLLKELNSNSDQSHTAMRQLATNEDWQVRAEVAEAISHRVTEAADDAPTIKGVRKIPFPQELRAAARDLLDDNDSFVLSKIVPALLAADQEHSFQRLLQVAWKNKTIRSEILPKLTDAKGKENADDFLIARFNSDEPADRAFALEAMSRFRIDAQEDYIKRGIEDSDSSVQLAAARSLVVWLDAYHARLDQLPPSPPNNDPFSAVRIGIQSDVVFEQEFHFETAVETTQPSMVGGLLGTFGSLFGGGNQPQPATPAAIDETLEPLANDEASGVELDDDDAEKGPGRLKAVKEQSREPDSLPELEDEQNEQILSIPATQILQPTETAVEAESEFDAATGKESPAMIARIKTAAQYDQWLLQWRQSPESTLPWLAGLRPRLQKLATEGGETETHAMMAILRLGGSAEAERILELAARSTQISTRLASLYPWLDPATRRQLFELAGDSDDSATLLPRLLQQSRRYDPKHSTQSFWNALRRVNLSALDSSYELRRKLMLVTTGTEYFNGDPGKFESIAEQLANRLRVIHEPAARLLGLSVLGEIAPLKVSDLIGSDYADLSSDEALRRDWARMAVASRGEEEAIALALELFDDPVLLPVALTFITESYEGISVTETGSLQVSAVGQQYYPSGKLTVPRIPAMIEREKIEPLLQHDDAAIVARATYALAVMGQEVDLSPLISQARSTGFSQYLQGMTDLLVLAIASRNRDDEVAILEEVYSKMEADNPYYIREFYWKIRIMTGPKALALRKRIRDDVGMSQLT